MFVGSPGIRGRKLMEGLAPETKHMLCVCVFNITWESSAVSAVQICCLTGTTGFSL